MLRSKFLFSLVLSAILFQAASAVGTANGFDRSVAAVDGDHLRASSASERKLARQLDLKWEQDPPSQEEFMKSWTDDDFKYTAEDEAEGVAVKKAEDDVVSTENALVGLIQETPDEILAPEQDSPPAEDGEMYKGEPDVTPPKFLETVSGRRTHMGSRVRIKYVRARQFLHSARKAYVIVASRRLARRRFSYFRNHEMRTNFRYALDSIRRVVGAQGYVGTRFRPLGVARSMAGVGYYSGMNKLMRTLYFGSLAGGAAYGRECGHIIADSLGGSPYSVYNFMSQTPRSNRGEGGPSDWYNQEMLALSIARRYPACRGRFCIHLNVRLSYVDGNLTPDRGRYTVTLDAACYNSLSPAIKIKFTRKASNEYVRAKSWTN